MAGGPMPPLSPASSPAPRAQRWLIGGLVQGVGFRPFVYLLANQLRLSGTVRNCGGHVEVVCGGDTAECGSFLRKLLSEHPGIARPRLVTTEPCAPPTGSGFLILPSICGGDAIVPVDQSICDLCLREMAEPTSRRHLYPFITCTQCGPRYTIMAGAPFDREATVMAEFPLCGACWAEYGSPLDRRFHAQVMACPDCGPRLWFRDGSAELRGNARAVAGAVAALRTGAIVAVKGIGGYHLLCDACDDAALDRLRARKRRPTKPLAVMFPRSGDDGLEILRRHCAPDAVESHSLGSSARPIVLVPLRRGSGLSKTLAPGLAELGTFLPYSPLHDLIVGAFGRPLVVTSGNLSGEPVVTEEIGAEHRLRAIADAFLHHDRPILRPAEDGVVRVIAGRARIVRLGRGSAPMERVLARALTLPVLALGGQMKVTVALGFDTRVVISPHLGDLDSPRGLEALIATTETLQRLHGVHAESLVCDSHNGYTSTRWAVAHGALPVIRIPHHQAHAAAVAGEFPQESRWLCFTWDGVGLGEDGTLWGGEALLGRPGTWSRVATFRPFAPPGGDKAAREPWRSAAALAWELGLDWMPEDVDAALAKAAWERRLNCPATSSAGRLFDAAAALLHLVQHANHEGEAPMAVEAAAAADPGTPGAAALVMPLQRRTDGVWQADWGPLVSLLTQKARPAGHRAAAFQTSMVRTLVDQAIAIRQEHGPFAVGLTGGVFQNRTVSEMALHALSAAGFRPFLPETMPCNDGGLSFGQIVEAAARQTDACR